jgi:N-acetylmuramoyl-L-alanine amidase
MNGPIAVIMAALLAASSAIGGADYSGLIAEAERIEQEQKEKEIASQYLIAIDAGHQGKGNFGQEPIGPGASQTKTKVAGGTRGTSTGVPEYELTLDISLQLRDELETRGYKVLMIRETNDVDITNAERAQIANEADADAFIRVHANGADSASANGAMTICQTPSNPYNSEYYEDSKRLSELVLDAYTEATGIRKQYVQETDTMTGINWCTVPVTIIELGFMTNPEEDRKMQDDEFQKLMVQGLADGIEAYIEEKKETDTELTQESDDTEQEEIEAPVAEEAADSSTEFAAVTEPDEDGSDFTEEEEPEEEEDPEEEERKREEERLRAEARAKEEKAQALRDQLALSDLAAARKTRKSAQKAGELIDRAGSEIVKRYKDELFAKTSAEMEALEEELHAEIGKLGGKWSLYFKRLDTDQSIGISDDEKMVAASLIKLFVAGEFYTLAEQGELDIEKYHNAPDLMISISDNGAANSLINACTMEKINEFAKEKGYEETELNRRMLEWNGTENYTSARDCGRMLEEVLKGEYVSGEASERILEDLRNQKRTSKIPAGVPDGIETANKTGELDNVDNDAAIIWSPSCTYILCIMSSDAGGRISEIRKLSSMVYNAVNPVPDEAGNNDVLN